MYHSKHCFICRSLDSTVSEDAGIEPSQASTITALTIRLNLIHQNKIMIFFVIFGSAPGKKIRIFQPCIKYRTYLPLWIRGSFCRDELLPPAAEPGDPGEEQPAVPPHGYGSCLPTKNPRFSGPNNLIIDRKIQCASWSHSSISSYLP
jgi:hypothetical protein